MTDINSKIAIFGGSFDPIHKAHIELIKNLCNRFDKVIIVPGYRTPFKVDTKTASPIDRIEMLKLAVGNIEKAEISEFEIDMKGVSYSIDTALHFSGRGELYWVIGSEMLYKLCGWHRIDELKKLVTFYIVKRPGFDINNLADLKKADIAYQISDFEGTEASSSKVKLDIAFNVHSELSKGVYKYIKSHGLYCDYKYIVDRYNEFNMYPSRIRHSYNVALTAIALAKRYGVNVEKAITAALLHDIGKCLNETDLKNRGLYTDEPIEPCRHAQIGEQIAYKYFSVKDREILNAIKFHTVGNKSMDNLAKIIFLADYIEPSRKFNGLDEIRKMSMIDLDETVIMVLQNTVKYLQGKSVIHKDSIETLNFLIEQRSNKK